MILLIMQEWAIIHDIMELLPISSSLLLSILQIDQLETLHVISGINIITTLYFRDMKQIIFDLYNWQYYIFFFLGVGIPFALLKSHLLLWTLYQKIMINIIVGIWLLILYCKSEGMYTKLSSIHYFIFGVLSVLAYKLAISRLTIFLLFCLCLHLPAKYAIFFSIKLSNILNSTYLLLCFYNHSISLTLMLYHLCLGLLFLPFRVLIINYLVNNLRYIIFGSCLLKILYIIIFMFFPS